MFFGGNYNHKSDRDMGLINQWRRIEKHDHAPPLSDGTEIKSLIPGGKQM